MRILLLRSFNKAPFSANIARALTDCKQVEFMQYPPWPQDRLGRVEKLYRSDEAWKALGENTIETSREFLERLDRGDFDLALLVDYEGQLFEYSGLSKLQKAKRRVRMLQHMFGPKAATVRAHAEYARALPLSLAELNSRVPVVAIDWSDTSFLTAPNQKLLLESSLYFKRELPFDRLFLFYHDRPAPWTVRRKELLPSLDTVHGIPLGIEDKKYRELKTLRVTEQNIDVLFVGEVTNTLRKTGVECLRELAATRGWNIVITQGLSFDEYCRMMARSKITISIAGGGWDCFRHYEAPALGSLPLMNRPTIDAFWWHSMPEELFFENTFVNFSARIERLLADGALRQRCFQALETQIEQHMLHSKIVEYIVQTSLEKFSLQVR